MPFDVATVRAQFPIFRPVPDTPPLHYLDSGASAQVPEAVIEAIIRHETTSRANVKRGVHRLAEAATEAYAAARVDVARYINAAPDEVIFTSGTTAAINLVAYALGGTFGPGDEVVFSELEHHSNLVPWHMLRDRRGVTLKVLPVSDEGRIDLAALERVVTPRTRLVALAHVSNVTGAVLDPAPVVAAAKAAGARVLLDGAQRAPHGPLDVSGLDVDFYAFSSHKMFGPNGVGVLWGKREVLADLPPFLGGGEMIRTVTLERTIYAASPARFEAGTPPIAQAIGMGAAARWLMTHDWPAVAAHEMRLTQRLLDGLGGVKGARVLGPPGLQGRAPVVSFELDGAHPHDVCQILDSHGVALRGGHHCAQPLHDRFGLAGTTRASLALYNDDGDIDALLAGLDDALARLT